MKSIDIFMFIFILFSIKTLSNAKLKYKTKSFDILFCASNDEIRFAYLNESLITANGIYKQTKSRFPEISKSRHDINGNYSRDLNYDINDNYIVWSNPTSILVAPLNKNSKNSLKINNRKVLYKANEVNKLSLDWIHDLIYFIENGDIYVINANNLKKKKILSFKNNYKKNYRVTDVVVNPIDLFIVWIQLNEKFSDFKIVRSDQNGSNKKILTDNGFNGYKSRVFHPSCLTIDYDSNRIYFIDKKSQTLESMLFDGKERVRHSQSSLFSSANSLDIYDNYIYWSNERQNTILRSNKNGIDGRVDIVLRSNSNIGCIRVLHNSRQPKGENICSSAQCSHICIPVSSDQYQCVCEANLTKDENCQEYLYSSKNMNSNSVNVGKYSLESKVTEVVITESLTKSYPLYVFKCNAITDENNQTIQMDWFTEDNIKLSQKFKKYLMSENITTDGNTTQLIVSYPYVKKLKTFKCKANSPNEAAEEEVYKIIYRQFPTNPKILSHSLSFAGVSRIYITLQIENTRIEPPIDKYRLVYKGLFNKAYYQKEYSVEFNPINGNDRNSIYVIKLDVDYISADLISFKLYAHNEIGWSYSANIK